MTKKIPVRRLEPCRHNRRKRRCALCGGRDKGFYLSLGIRPAAEFPLCDGISEVMKEDIKKRDFALKSKRSLSAWSKPLPQVLLPRRRWLYRRSGNSTKIFAKPRCAEDMKIFFPLCCQGLPFRILPSFMWLAFFGDGVSLCTVERGEKAVPSFKRADRAGLSLRGLRLENGRLFAARKYEENYANPLYLLTENPLAARLYRVGGFEQIEFGKKLFRATLEEGQWQRFKSKNKPKNA